MWRCDMLQCDNVTMWRCHNVTCDNVTMWQCDMLQCDNVTMWQCDDVTMWRVKFVLIVEMWQCDDVTMWQCDNVKFVLIVEMWRCEIRFNCWNVTRMNQVVNSFSRAGFIGALSNLMMRRNEKKKKIVRKHLVLNWGHHWNRTTGLGVPPLGILVEEGFTLL